MKSNILKITFAGLLSSFSVLIMLIGSALGIATYIAPAAAGLLIMPLYVEFGEKTAYTAFATVSVLSLFLIPDRELSFMFVFLLGYYPVLKGRIEQIKNKIVKLILKLCIFNIPVTGMYFILLKVFTINTLTAEFNDLSSAFVLILLVIGNVTFILYDIALRNYLYLYIKKIQPKIFKFLK